MTGVPDAIPAGGSVVVVEEAVTALAEHARIPIAFDVDRVLDVEATEAGFALRERLVSVPYRKDYDAIPGNSPLEWASEFDLSKWGLLAARIDSRRVGGALLAFDTPGVTMLEGRRDLAVLWDIRVAPDHRRSGVGTALFRAAERWAASRGCRELKVETQDTNVPACRFYARMGCEFRQARKGAYAESPTETQLLWYRRLASR